MLPSVVEHLKEYFPDKAGNILWPIVQNELAKKSFEYKPFVSSILDSGFNSESWRLGSLARICLIKQEELLPDLRVDAQNLLLAQLSRTPLDSYSSFDLLSDPVKFAITGAWAEELVGIVNDAGWEEFRQLLGIGTSSFVHDRLPFFRSSLIYMSHLLIDPWELVQMLGGHFEDREVLQMCGFIYCSYYFENEILVQQLMKFLTKISLAARLIVLRYLFQHDKKEVVSFLSEQLLAHDDDFTSSQTEINHSLDEIYAIANGYYHLSLLQFAGKKEEGERVWNELENAQNAWKAGVFLQKAQVLENWDGIIDFQNSLENLRKNDFDTQPLMEELWSLSGHREFPVSVQAAQHSPFALIQKYQDAFNNKKDDETDALAEQIVSDLKSHLSDNVAERDPKYLLKMDYDNIVEKFLQVNDLEHAEQAAVILLDKFPSDAKLMRYLAEIKEKQGSIQE
ncbi:MAG: hypothetical protein LLG42_04780, partial [Chloroflexi bacterium]|nr:hypothetical protein [Chloroflexota bacterium]